VYFAAATSVTGVISAGLRRTAKSHFFNGVPLAALITLTGPARIISAAFGANKSGFGFFGHDIKRI
jgi:hypothetical protein